MPLKAVCSQEEFEGLPEGQQQLYKQAEDGRYWVDIAPVSWTEGATTHMVAVEDVGSLKTTLSKQKEQIAGFKTQVKIFEGIDPEEARSAIKKMAELGEIPTDGDIRKQVEQRVEVIRAQLEGKHKNKMTARDGLMTQTAEKLRLREDQLKRQLIDNAAIQAITAEKGSVELLLPHVQKRCRCVESEDGKDYIVQVLDPNGNEALSAATGSIEPMTIPELIGQMKESPTYAVAFQGTQAAGAGANSSGGGSTRPYVLTAAQARNPAAYRAAKETAAKAGQEVQIQG